MQKKENILFFCLAGFFICNVIVAEMIGSKIFSVEKTLGFSPLNWSLGEQNNLSVNMSAGTIPWPFVFILTDIINEYYGKQGVRLITGLTAGLILYAFGMIYLAIHAEPADMWLSFNTDIQPNVNAAYQKVLGQGMNIIIGSSITFLISQWLDAWIFHNMRKKLGEQAVGQRALLSTLISQLLDSFLVGFIAFYLLGNWTMSFLLTLLVVSYPYKFLVAILSTPLLYLAHYAIEKYLGAELAAELKAKARSGTSLTSAANS